MLVALARWLPLACTLVLCGSLAAPVSAATPEEQARALFEQGLVASDARRWADAAQLFQRSRELVERPSTLFNLVVVLHRLGRHRDGLEAGAAYLRVATAETDAKRSEVERLLSEMQLAVGTLRLKVQPRRARVELDGAALPEQDTSHALALDPGRHVLTVSAPGHETQTRELNLEHGGKQSLEVTLLPVAERSLPPVSVVADDGSLPGSALAEPGSTRRQRRLRRALWTAGTLLVAGGLAALIVTTRPEETRPEPTGGSTGITLPL
jgi:hypothetical protein